MSRQPIVIRVYLSAMLWLLCVVIAGLAAAWVTRAALYDQQRQRFETAARNHVTLLSHSIEHAKPGGAVRALGLTNRGLADYLTAPHPDLFTALTATLDALRNHFDADLVYVMRTDGTVVAVAPAYDEQDVDINNFAFRPYFRKALQGKPYVYIGLGVTTARRGMYYSAPVYEPGGTNVVGVAVIKMPIHMLDERLDSMHALTMLMAPDGVVYAANNPDFVLQPIQLDAGDRIASIDGVVYAVSSHVLPLVEGPSDWRIVCLDPIAGWVPSAFPAAVGLTVAALVSMLLLFVRHWQEHWRRREHDMLRSQDLLQHEISESHERVRQLATAVEQVEESILITDADGIIVYANPFLLKHTGYAPEDMIGKHVREFKSGRQNDAFYRAMWLTLAAGSVWRGRLMNRKRDGSLYEEDAVISPIRSQTDGTITGYVAVKRDITETQILERQVRESQKMAAIGQLSHRIAHDFTNVLVVITGHAEMAKSEVQENVQLRVHFDAILKAVNKITPLTTELMLFAQPEDIQPLRMDLAATLEKKTAMLQNLAPESVTVEIITPPEGTGGHVYMDDALIEQALVHMAVNAFEAMPSGGTLTVEILPLKAVPLTDHACVVVKDTGCGIPEPHIERLFEPFFTTKRHDRNAGLGLSTVFRIVNIHHGRITVESDMGKGTTFRVFLPLAD